MEESCDLCDDYEICSGLVCPYHTENRGIVKEMCDAMNQGHLWGDMIYEKEVLDRASESADDKKLRFIKECAQEKESFDRLKEEILGKTRRLHCVLVDGNYVLKHKMRRSCENLKQPDLLLPDGTVYSSKSCWAQDKNICPFMHPGEEHLYKFPDNKSYVELISPSSLSPSKFSPRPITPTKIEESYFWKRK